MERDEDVARIDAKATGAEPAGGALRTAGDASRMNGAQQKNGLAGSSPPREQGRNAREDGSRPGPAAHQHETDAVAPALEKPGLGLSTKLLLFTVAFVMLAEILIFVPSVANFRVTWLKDRLVASHLAALAAEAAPNGKVPDVLRDELLETAKVRSIAVKRNDQRRMVLMSDLPNNVDIVIDLRQPSAPAGIAAGLGRKLTLIWDAICVFLPRGDQILLVKGEADQHANGYVEFTVPEAPLKAAMINYGLNILLLSVIISIISAALVYLTLNNLLIKPMKRITDNMLNFSRKPEDTSRIITPSGRSDEIGVAERELAHMQSELTQMLHQKNRLAALGLAVSKISHDLRNMLASAQLISDRLGTLPDPTVQRFAPKLIASLDRAITFCKDTLSFGRTHEATPHRDLFPLQPLLAEVGDSLGLPCEGRIGWRIDTDDALQIDADREQLFRVLSNLGRNATQAIEGQSAKVLAGAAGHAASGQANGQDGALLGEITITAWRVGRTVCIEVSDDGPGIPPRARENLFKAFQGSTRKGGTGLGLVIAQELVVAHGGTMELVETARGAKFRFSLPDRSA